MGSVKFYSCKDDNRKLNKSLTEITTLTVNFKGPVSETDPELFVETFDFGNVNYFYLSDFNRFYFVTDITPVPGGVRVTGHVDVLMSFKDQISNVSGIVTRSTNINNDYLSDPDIKLLQYKRYETKKSTGSFDTNLSYYLVVAG